MVPRDGRATAADLEIPVGEVAMFRLEAALALSLLLVDSPAALDSEESTGSGFGSIFGTGGTLGVENILGRHINFILYFTFNEKRSITFREF